MGVSAARPHRPNSPRATPGAAHAGERDSARDEARREPVVPTNTGQGMPRYLAPPAQALDASAANADTTALDDEAPTAVAARPRAPGREEQGFAQAPDTGAESAERAEPGAAGEGGSTAATETAEATEATEAEQQAAAETEADTTAQEAEAELAVVEAGEDTATGGTDEGAAGAGGSEGGGEGDGAAAGDLALIDEELAEHERWAGSFGALGTAGSDQRARFLLERTGQGAASGLAGGLGMGFMMGAIGGAVGQIAGRRLATLAVSRGAMAVPVPGLGPAIGGVMAVAGLAMRDWGSTAETIGRIGTGEGYEGLANDLEGLAEILDVACSIMDVVGGVLGAIAVGMWIGAVLSAGALSPLALTLSAIATGITLATTAIGIIISVVIRPAVTALRALHTFESQGDPAQIEAEGALLESAAGQITGAVGGAVGGRAGGRAGTRGGTHIDRGARHLAERRGGPPATRTSARPGPRLHVEVPASPAAAGSSPPPVAPLSPSVRPAGAGGPSAAAPGRRGNRRTTSEGEVDRRQAEILEDIAEHQRLASGAPLGEPELGALPGPPGRHLRPGERDPGNFRMTPAARSRVGSEGKTAGIRDLGEAVASGIDTPRTAAARENLTPDQLLALTDPEMRRIDRESSGTDEPSYRDVERSIEASHVPGVATEPHEAHLGTNVEIIPREAHREGIHQGDTTRPLETATPGPDYRGRPGFHPSGERARPNPRTDRGVLRGAEADARRLEENFPDARPEEIAAARLWLAQRRAELAESGAQNLPTPARAGGRPSARSPAAHHGEAGSPAARLPSHTETVRSTDRAAAMAQYHAQVRSDPGRESGVWQGADGTYYVMQGDAGSVSPPAAAGPLRLIYHSHPAAADAAGRALVTQPSQAGGDFGVLQHQHGEGRAGTRQDSELHFPVYGADGSQSGYGTTRFSYDPTSPLPLQVTTTVPGGRPSTQRYASFAEFEARTGIGASADTAADAGAVRAAADTRLQADVAAAQRQTEATARGLFAGPPILGPREGREAGRQLIEAEQRERAAAGPAAAGPEYTAAVGGLAPGEAIELPINPAYPPPPGTTAELEALRVQIGAARDAETVLDATGQRMAGQAEEQRAHDAELGEAMDVSAHLVEGRSAHQAETDGTGEANASMADEAGAAVTALGQSAQEAGAVATLVGSLRAFQGMADLFSLLPGNLGRRAEQASADTTRLIAALNRVSDADAAQADVEAGRGVIDADAGRIDAVTAAGAATDADLAAGQAGVESLQAANADSLAETEATQEQAATELTAAKATEDDAQSAHDTLLGELQTWAQTHRQAREDAIQAAIAEYQASGLLARELR